MTEERKPLMANPRVCTYPGCGAVVYEGSRCPRHPYDRQRTQDRTPYDSPEWRGLSAAFLKRHPVCACGRPAQHADHRVPVRDGGAFLDWSNLQPLCKACHSRKSAQEHRFGREGNQPMSVDSSEPPRSLDFWRQRLRPKAEQPPPVQPVHQPVQPVKPTRDDEPDLGV